MPELPPLLPINAYGGPIRALEDKAKELLEKKFHGLVSRGPGTLFIVTKNPLTLLQVEPGWQEDPAGAVTRAVPSSAE